VLFFAQPIERYPLHELGPKVEHHALFPQRVNFGVARVLGRERIDVRVWERGVGETLACGSGCCAAMVAARLHNLVDERVDRDQSRLERLAGKSVSLDFHQLPQFHFAEIVLGQPEIELERAHVLQRHQVLPFFHVIADTDLAQADGGIERSEDARFRQTRLDQGQVRLRDLQTIERLIPGVGADSPLPSIAPGSMWRLHAADGQCRLRQNGANPESRGVIASSSGRSPRRWLRRSSFY